MFSVVRNSSSEFLESRLNVSHDSVRFVNDSKGLSADALILLEKPFGTLFLIALPPLIPCVDQFAVNQLELTALDYVHNSVGDILTSGPMSLNKDVSLGTVTQ